LLGRTFDITGRKHFAVAITGPTRMHTVTLKPKYPVSNADRLTVRIGLFYSALDAGLIEEV
jgi:hypothetical protein